MGIESKFKKINLSWETNTRDLHLEEGKDLISGYDKCKYLRVAINKDGKQDEEIKIRVTEDRSVINMLNGI